MTGKTKAIAACALVAMLAFAVTLRQSNVPVLPLWLVPASIAGALIALLPRIEGPAGGRILDLLLLYAFAVPVSLLAIFLAARGRTQSAHVAYHGVRLANTDAVAIGANSDSLDVSLQSGARGEPWRVIAERDNTAGQTSAPRWTLQVTQPPEELLIATRATGLARLIPKRLISIEYWEPLSGLPVTAGSSATLHVPAHAAIGFESGAYPVSLEEVGRDLVIRVGQSSWYVWSASDSLNYRNARALGQGRYLSHLQQHSPSTLPVLSDLIRIRQLRATERVGESPTIRTAFRALLDRALPGGFRQPRFLLSVAAPLTFTNGQQASFTPTDAATGTEMVARDGGDFWRFRWTASNRNVDVEFVRRPRVRSLPLTASTSCAPGAACNVAGLRRLPPPAEQLLFSEGGLDSSRFTLFGRFFTDGGTVWFVSDTARVPVPENDEGLWLAASRRPDAPSGDVSAAIHISAARNSVASPVQVSMIGVALMLLLGAMFFAIRAAVEGGALNVGAIAERPFALALNALLALALARLILGLRVTVFAPFNELGVETAVGLWVSIAIAVGALLTWRIWYPKVMRWSRGPDTAIPLALRVAASWRWIRRVPRKVTESLASLPGAYTRFTEYPRDVQRALIVGGLALACLFVTTFGALGTGVLLGLIVPTIWASVSGGVVWASGNDHGVIGNSRGGPWGLLEAQLPARSSGSGLLLVWRLLGGIALPGLLAVVFPEVFLATAALVVVLGILGSSLPPASRLRRLALAPGYPSTQFRRTWFLLGAPLCLLAFVSTSRSAAALGLALYVALLALRLSASVAQATNENAGPRRVDWLGAIALPLVVLTFLLPLVATDVGLFLVIMIPVMLAATIAGGGTPSGTLRRVTAIAVLFGVLGLLYSKLLGQPTDRILTGSPVQVDAEVQRMQSWLGLERIEKLRRSLANVASRGLAAKDRRAAERALALAGPSETRDFLAPAIEQTWGTRAYSAANWTGVGLGEAPLGGRGIAAPVAYAEHSFAVFVMAEHGLAGGLAIILCYVFLAVAAIGLLGLRSDLLIGSRNMAMRALLFLSTALVILPATYVALSNVGALPITGQNMPFLGLNARSDVLFTTGVLTFFLVAAMRLHSEAVGRALTRRRDDA